MPELPEVETIKRGLETVIIGKQIASADVLEERCFPNFRETTLGLLRNTTIKKLGRCGKLLLIHLDNNYSLTIHLRMTGQLVYRDPAYDPTSNSASNLDSNSVVSLTSSSSNNSTSNTSITNEPSGISISNNSSGNSSDFGGGYPSPSLVRALPDKSTRIIFTFADDSHLYFNDQRKFGYIKLLPTSELKHDNFIKNLGPDPLDNNFNANVLKATLPLTSKRSIKAVLLDQKIIAGIGNIYADESLFAAKIDPSRAANTLTDTEIETLAKTIPHCMRQSIAAGGSTMRNYVDSLGQRGEYLDLYAQVFNRTGKPCPVCGKPIEKTRVAGRGTHWCGYCQR